MPVDVSRPVPGRMDADMRTST